MRGCRVVDGRWLLEPVRSYLSSWRAWCFAGPGAVDVEHDLYIAPTASLTAFVQ
jgi:hypothetical protein